MRTIGFMTVGLVGLFTIISVIFIGLPRAESEGPSRMIGVTFEDPTNPGLCRLEIVTLEIGAHRSLTESAFDCGLSIIGWSADLNTLYFEINSVVMGVDRDFKPRKLVDPLPDDPRLLSPDPRYLLGFTWVEAQEFYLQRGETLQGIKPQHDFLPGEYWYVALQNDTSVSLAIFNLHDVSNIPDLPDRRVYRAKRDGSELQLIASNLQGIYFTNWLHKTGLVGVLEADTFRAIQLDTGQPLWELSRVQRVYSGVQYDEINPVLDTEWVHFKMTDGRLARCRMDGSDLTFYDTSNFAVGTVWGWSADGEWVWFEIPGSNSTTVDVVRVQRRTGHVQLIADEINSRFITWSLDGEWGFFKAQDGYLFRVKLDGTTQPEPVLRNATVLPLAWTPPYQAEWQPTRTLAIGIGLMSFSTLTPVVLWRRRHKPRPA